MTHFRTTALATGCLLVLTAATAAAQTPIRAGQTVRGALTASDPRADDDSFYDLYTYAARAGERLTITLKSTEFDAYLSFGRVVGGEFEEIESDDDGAGGTDARLQVTVPAAGTYAIRANSLNEGETGDYELSLAQGAATRPGPAPRAAEIAFGQTVRGSLSASDPRLESDDTFYDLYRFTGRAGQRVEIAMNSAAFDAYLALGRLNGGEFEVERSDDDGGGGSNARIRATLPAAGTYTIRANSLSEGETGAYTLTLRELPAPPPPPAPAAIAAGVTVRGTLATTDPQADDESYFDAYAYTGRAGEQLTIEMASPDFDTFLVVGRMVGGQFEQLASDDDGAGEGTNSRLVFSLPAAGTYVIRANSLSAESTGAYTLLVRSGR